MQRVLMQRTRMCMLVHLQKIQKEIVSGLFDFFKSQNYILYNVLNWKAELSKV